MRNKLRVKNSLNLDILVITDSVIFETKDGMTSYDLLFQKIGSLGCHAKTQKMSYSPCYKYINSSRLCFRV